MRFSMLLACGAIITGCAANETGKQNAEQYLCVAKTVIWTTTSDNGDKVTGHNFDGADSKYLFSNNDGDWQARGIGDGSWSFDHCDSSGLLCEVRNPGEQSPLRVFEGAISRNAESGTFYASGVKRDTANSHVFVVTGTCSRHFIVI